MALFIDYRGKTPAKISSGVRLLTAKDVQPGHINTDPEEFISEATYDSWMTRGTPRIGDILFTTEAPMGNAAVIAITERVEVAQRTMCFRPYGALNPHFLVLQLLSPAFQRILESEATGLTAKGIKSAKLQRLPLAVPPLEEQRRIAERVVELMTLCDSLQRNIATTPQFFLCFTKPVLLEAISQ